MLKSILEKSDEYDLTPLKHAILDRDKKMVKILLNQGISIISDFDNITNSALENAWCEGEMCIFQLIFINYLSFTTIQDYDQVIDSMMSWGFNQFYEYINTLNDKVEMNDSRKGSLILFTQRLESRYIEYCNYHTEELGAIINELNITEDKERVFAK